MEHFEDDDDNDDDSDDVEDSVHGSWIARRYSRRQAILSAQRENRATSRSAPNFIADVSTLSTAFLLSMKRPSRIEDDEIHAYLVRASARITDRV